MHSPFFLYALRIKEDAEVNGNQQEPGSRKTGCLIEKNEFQFPASKGLLGERGSNCDYFLSLA